jgi:hypothetical protein
MKAEHRPPAPPRQAPTPPPALPAAADQDRAAAAAPRRDTERPRSASMRLEPEPIINADGQFFAQLISPVGEGAEQQGFGGSTIAAPLQSEAAPAELVDELAQCLAKAPQVPFNVTLLMPNLGRVDVSATPHEGHWGVELTFARREVLRRLKPKARECESALASALGQPVALTLLDEECA